MQWHITKLRNKLPFVLSSNIFAVVGKVTVTPLQSYKTSYFFLGVTLTFSLHFK
jgi:hypothetical protein